MTMTVLDLVGDYPGVDGSPACEWCVTVHGMEGELSKEVGDHPWVGSWY